VLYLDSSALIKHYLRERGTDAVDARLQAEARSSRSVFTSVLTYAEMHAVLARKAREKALSPAQATAVQDRFIEDWVLEISPIELGTNVLVRMRFTSHRRFGFVTWQDWAQSPINMRGRSFSHRQTGNYLVPLARTNSKYLTRKPGNNISFANCLGLAEKLRPGRR
jgi:uncharacterized protein with PIN domain